MTTSTEVNWASIPQVSALNSQSKNLRLDVQTESVDPLAFIWSNRASIGLLIDQRNILRWPVFAGCIIKTMYR